MFSRSIARFCRCSASAALLLSIALPSSALSLTTAADSPLAAASARMKLKDFAGAREAALQSNGGAVRAFLIGMSCVRLELWEEAASQLAVAAEGYPLLADYALFYQGTALAKLGRVDQALFKARRYQDAEQTLRGVGQVAGGAVASESSFWLAKALDKNGKSDQAYELFLRLAQAPQGGAVAGDALLEAAYQKRYQKKWDEALRLFQRYLTTHPDPQQAGSIIWEAAWTSYQSHDYQGAAGYLRKLAANAELREKALYWLGKSLGNAGDAKGAQLAFASLAEEYPFGYYALICNKWCDLGAFPTPPQSLSQALPIPTGFEREKALISLGLFDEAARELSAARKGKNPLGIARLFLEMENYNGALHAVAKENWKPTLKESASVWGINYPMAYRDDVIKNAAATAVPESLIYAIMRTESNYFPAALSPVGAVGLMQIMPSTAETISKGASARLATPELNIRLGAKHLKSLLDLYDKNVQLAAAAYNAGAGNVKKWQKGLGALPRDEFVESIPFRETREYVKKVVTAMELYQRLYRLPAYKK